MRNYQSPARMLPAGVITAQCRTAMGLLSGQGFAQRHERTAHVSWRRALGAHDANPVTQLHNLAFKTSLGQTWNLVPPYKSAHTQQTTEPLCQSVNKSNFHLRPGTPQLTEAYPVTGSSKACTALSKPPSTCRRSRATQG